MTRWKPISRIFLWCYRKLLALASNIVHISNTFLTCSTLNRPRGISTMLSCNSIAPSPSQYVHASMFFSLSPPFHLLPPFMIEVHLKVYIERAHSRFSMVVPVFSCSRKPPAQIFIQCELLECFSPPFRAYWVLNGNGQYNTAILPNCFCNKVYQGQVHVCCWQRKQAVTLILGVVSNQSRKIKTAF